MLPAPKANQWSAPMGGTHVQKRVDDAKVVGALKAHTYLPFSRPIYWSQAVEAEAGPFFRRHNTPEISARG